MHAGSPGTLLASWLQTAFLLPFCPAAWCVACSAAASAAPVLREGVKAFLRVMRCAGNAGDQGCPCIHKVSHSSKPLLAKVLLLFTSSISSLPPVSRSR